MYTLVRRFIKTGIMFLFLGLIVGAWMLVRRDLLGIWPSPYLVSAHAHAVLVGFVMFLILGVALWLFPRAPKEDTRYRPARAAAAYWVLLFATGGRFVAEAARAWSTAPWLGWIVVLGGLGQIAGLAIYFWTMWPRIRPSVVARVRDGSVRRALSDLGHLSSRVRADRLTWAGESHPVRVTDVQVNTVYATEDDFTVTCSYPQQSFGPDSGVMPVSYGHNGGTESQVAIWARHMVFGEPLDRGRHRSDMLLSMSVPDGVPTLPDVLREHQASGWLAEGLTRLYIVEELVTQHGGHFPRLEAGPATASGVRVDIQYLPAGHNVTPVLIGGVIPLR